MTYRTAYIRRSRKVSRLKQRAAAVAVLAVAACAAAVLAPKLHAPAQQQLAQAGSAARQAMPAARLRIADAVDSNGTRRIYPYSIVPGGVGSRSDLKNIVRTDKGVAAHYASFEVDKARATTVARPRAAYVSYRKGDQVYWTANKVMLAEGETVLTDGQNEIRGRCGNRISDTAQLPVEPKGPTEEELDASVEEEADGKLNVGYAYDGEAGGRSHELLAFANGAGMLTVTGGGAWREPSNPFGPMTGGIVPSGIYGAPVTLVEDAGSSGAIGGSGSGSTVETRSPAKGGTSADTVPTAPATVDTVADTMPAAVIATGGRSTTETPRATGTPAVPVALPVLLSDTVQPVTDVEVKAPSIPETLLWPAELPTVPVEPAVTADAPEPATLWLSGVGLAAMLLRRRRPRH